MNTVDPAIAAPAQDRTERFIRILGWAATVSAVLMYVSYIDQIHRNLAGDKGSTIQPLVTAINCSLWVSYGFFRRVRDWPIVLANSPGIVLGVATLVTAL